MEFKEQRSKKILMIPSHVVKNNEANGTIILEFKSIRLFNKFMNNLGDLLDFKGCKFHINNQKNLRTLFLEDLTSSSYIEIYQYIERLIKKGD